jgi:2-polyprenyl-3-methyl-5-hydroxy-6-metoxy-1,4-benzoquinol methylase
VTAAAAPEVDAMVEKLFGSVLGGMEALTIAIGDRLGYYTALKGGPLTSGELARSTGTHERYAREWLEQQAVCGYLAVVAPGDGTTRQYALAPGVAETLATPEALTTMAPLARMVAAAGAQWTRIADGARTGRGLGWREYGQDMLEAQADVNRPPLLSELPDSWLPDALPELHARLVAGEPLLVADVGCGAGWAAIGLATRFPSVTVHGFDVDPPSVQLARANAEQAGVADRVQVFETDIAEHHPGGGYHLALAVECIHDMSQPVPVLAAMRTMVGRDGHVLVVDEKVADEFVAPGDDVERLMYGYSTLVCLPDSMSAPRTVATGTVIRPQTMQQYAREAGFAAAELLGVEHDLWRFYALRR